MRMSRWVPMLDPGRIRSGMRILAVQRPGFFNFEGGSYAKTIGLSAKNEPEIYRFACRSVSAARSNGVSLENKGHNCRIVSRYAPTTRR